ncbi:MAG: hypothetical protein QM791_13970 [Ferruginibacter sp.]
MKKLLFCACICCSTVLIAQKTERIALKGWEVKDFVAKEGYRYPSFKNARVFFTNAEPAGGRLNYNYLLQTMQFVGDKGDTLVIADETYISHITIDTDTFFHQDGYLEKIAGNNKMRLAVKRILKTNGEAKKLGAYGIASATNNILSEGRIRSHATVNDLGVNEEYDFTRETAYYISVDNKTFTAISKKNISKLFPKRQEQIEAYMHENKTNLTKEEDVKKLFDYISSIN